MDVKVVKDETGEFEVEFSNKEVAIALSTILTESGVDAYTYEPHPLKPGFRLQVEAKNPKKEFTSALKKLDKSWSDLSKSIAENL